MNKDREDALRRLEILKGQVVSADWHSSRRADERRYKAEVETLVSYSFALYFSRTGHFFGPVKIIRNYSEVPPSRLREIMQLVGKKDGANNWIFYEDFEFVGEFVQNHYGCLGEIDEKMEFSNTRKFIVGFMKKDSQEKVSPELDASIYPSRDFRHFIHDLNGRRSSYPDNPNHQYP